ncbi:MAG: glycosyltransferase family 4 protein [Armatimonadota bacterium]|nr:glycosyltransferase family 4 protein [Armatimonadota bacterium]
MTHVLQVIQQGQLRGAEVFALDLSRALIQRGWRASVLSMADVDAAYAAAAAQAGVPLHVASARPRMPGLDARVVWRLREAIGAGGRQVVQANGAGTLKHLVAARQLGRGRWPLVYRAIGMGSFWRKGWVKAAVYRWLFNQADLVIAVCQAVARDLVEVSRIDPHKVTVVPNGVEPARLQAGPGDRDLVRATLGVGETDCLLVTVGSLTAEKNPEGLVELVAACRGQGLPVRGAIVGEGPLRAGLHAAIRRRGVQDAVSLVQPSLGLGSYLAAADVYVLPSHSEGMPAAVIEAGLAGVPAVAYDVGGLSEIVEDGTTGLLVSPGDVAGLVRAAAMLVRDPARRLTMGQAARRQYRRFRIGMVARSYQEAYEQLLARAG